MFVCSKHVQDDTSARRARLGTWHPEVACSARRHESFIVPHLIDVEVMSAIRRLVAGERIESHRTGQFLAGLAALPAERYSHTPLIGRIWELRHNFTAYDATYIALAEATGSVLYT